MKTLKQWYDSLSVSAQKWIDSNCSAWFDKNQADYYAKPEAATEVVDDLHTLLLNSQQFEKYSDSKNLRTMAVKYLSTLKYLNNTNPTLMPDAVLNEAATQMIDTGVANAWLYMTDEKKQEGFIRAYSHYDHIALKYYLYLIKDYDKIEIDWEKCEVPALTQAVIDIVGWDNAKAGSAYCNEYELAQMIKTKEPNELFDEIFFCKGSEFTQSKKMSLLNRIYANSTYLPTEETTEDFFKRIVAVDHCYLRFLFTIIDRYPALAMKLYQQKKPDSELTGNESVGEQYRYNKELRKLFVIAHACALKRISKVKGSIIKEVGPLLKIYGYKWNDIYDVMYPEDGYLV